MDRIDAVANGAPPAPNFRSERAEPNATRDAAPKHARQAAEPDRAEKADPAKRAEDLLRAVRRRNPSLGTRLRIEINDQARRFVYYSIDRETGEVVKQYPSKEELRRLIAGHEAGGISFDKRV